MLNVGNLGHFVIIGVSPCKDAKNIKCTWQFDDVSINVDLEQWPRYVSCDLGLYSSLRSVCPNIQCKYGMEK